MNDRGIARTIQAEINGQTQPVGLRYLDSRPFEIAFRFHTPYGGVQERWVGRELLALGLDRPVGVNIVVRPNTRAEVMVRWRDRLVLVLWREDLYDFLDSSWKLVPEGSELVGDLDEEWRNAA